MMNTKKLISGFLKITAAIILLIASMVLSIKGCQDTKEGLLDETNTPILDEDENEIKIE